MSIAATVIAAACLTTWLAVRATRAERRAEAEAQKARQSQYFADIALSQHTLEAGELGRAKRLLTQHLPVGTQADIRGWEWHYMWNQLQSDEVFILGEHPDSLSGVSVSPDGGLVVSSDYSGNIIHLSF